MNTDQTTAAQKIRDFVKSQSSTYGPGAVILTVTDGSRQLIDGYVWCTYGDKRVQCIAPANVGDLRGATETNPMIVWAIPPNPDQVSNYAYLAIGFGQNSNNVGGYGQSRVPPLLGTVVNDPNGNPITGGGSGTVTSVALTASPAGVFDVSGSPVTTSGTLALSLDSQAANIVLAGPTGGGAATPGFRALVAADIPSLSSVYIPNSIVNAKGDIIAASANDTPAIRSVGTDGQVLVADSGQSTGLNWGTRALSSEISVYTSDDTWTKPTGVVLVEVILIGGGGGGGSGRKGNSATHRRGGSGGGGGHVSYHAFIPSFLDASMTIDIGAGGGGGAAQTAGSTNGNDGNDGGNTRFLGASSGTIFLIAGGGKKGLGGGNDGTNAVVGGQGGSTWGGTNQTSGDGQYGGGGIGGNGGDGATSGGAAEYGGGGGGGTIPNNTVKDGGGSVYGGAGGAAGGGSAAANNTAHTAGVGGKTQNYGTGGGGSAGASGGANAGGNGSSPTYTRWGGDGGGGGGAGINGTADTSGGNGGNGGNYGGGGGGGGCATGTGNSGAGGNGAGGLAIIIAHY